MNMEVLQDYILYNKYPKLKESFIEDSTGDNENTIKTYIKTLSKCYKLENEWRKDLCEFSYDEISTLLGDLNAGTVSSLQTQHNIIKQYIQYAINEGYGNPLKINYAEMFKIKDFKQYINKIKVDNRIITKEDLLDIIESTDFYGGNAQDYCPLVLIFNGVWGKNLEELINLKREDIDENNSTLKLTKDNGDERTIKIDSEWIKYLIKASEETEYTILKSIEAMKFQTRKLINSPYVLKGYRNEKAEAQLIRQRFMRIRKFWGNEYITPKSILYSGMIHYAKKYKEKHKLKKLQTTSYKNISKRFGVNPNNWHTTTKRNIKKYVDNTD